MSAQGALILADLERHKTAFDLTRDGLGERLAEATAVGIFEAMDTESGPPEDAASLSGTAWPELSERYRAWKEAHFPGQPMAHLYGLMKTPDEIKGTLQIAPEEMTQTYGITEEAKQEAVWFQEGYASRPPRPFYALNGLCLRALADVLDARFDDVIGP